MSERWLSVEEMWKFKTQEVDEWVKSGGAADEEGRNKK